MLRVSIASGSEIATAAGISIARQGGNAVDGAIASALVSMCTDPGVMAPGASGFISIWHPQQGPSVIDAYAAMPALGLESWELGQASTKVFLEYGGGMETMVGYGSIATPGILAGLALASRQYGQLPWADLLTPTIEWTKKGFPLSTSAANYLAFTHQEIFGWHPDSYQTLHHPDNSYLKAGEIVKVPYLSETLARLASKGVEDFYQGELGEKIAQEIQSQGGLLTKKDLESYQAIPRRPIRIQIGDWEVITNPARNGGSCLAAILLLAAQENFTGWDSDSIARLVAIQQAVLNYRQSHFHQLGTIGEAAQQLLERAQMGSLFPWQKSPSTIHTSAVDSQGLACSISASAGYGSGAMIAETGLWFNNSLGELELHPEGLGNIQPGTRLVSNMAPTIARRQDGTVLAIGSPGASRITTALSMALINFLLLDMSLEEAIAHPRLHVETFQGEPTVAFEPGLNLTAVKGLALRPFPESSMYFGGVQACLWSPDTGLTQVADPRRDGSALSS